MAHNDRRDYGGLGHLREGIIWRTGGKGFGGGGVWGVGAGENEKGVGCEVGNRYCRISSKDSFMYM